MLAAFALSLAGLVLASTRLMDDPASCDAFAYLREARLFAARGWIGGLDTRVDDAGARLLVRIAQATGRPAGDWQHAVAPPCHHYEPQVGRVIDQYPPGTALALSLFSDGARLRQAMLAAGTILLALLAAMVLAAGAGPLVAAETAAMALAGWLLLVRGLMPLAEMVYSVVVTVPPLALLCALMTIGRRDGASLRRLAACAFGCGLLAGLLAGVRLPNLLLLPALVAGLWRPGWRLWLPALTAGLAVGLAPLAAADLINAGGVLRTTYAALDTAPASLAPDLVLAALRFYLIDFGLLSLWPLAALAIGLELASRERSAPALRAAGLALALPLAFFAVHTPTIRYYLVPAVLFAVLTVLFERVDRRRPGAVRRGLALAPLLAVLPLAWILGLDPPPSPPVSALAEEARARGGVVWGYRGAAGPASHYLGATAGELYHHTNPEVAHELIQRLRASGVPQYVVVRPADADQVLPRLGALFPLVPAGAMYGIPAYRLEPGP